jgi:hypothetical protein
MLNEFNDEFIYFLVDMDSYMYKKYLEDTYIISNKNFNEIMKEYVNMDRDKESVIKLLEKIKDR